jgi:hypothetical protein
MSEHEQALRSLLAGVKAKVDSAEAVLADLHNRQRVLEQMLVEEMGSAPARVLDTPRDDTPGTADVTLPSGGRMHFLTADEAWKVIGKTGAVKRVLSEADRPLGPTDIVDRLKSVGLPQKDTEAVRGALAWLKKKGVAKALGRSQWVLVEGSVDRRLRQEAPRTSSSEDSVAPESSDEETPTTEAGGDERYALHHDHRADFNGRHGDSDRQAPIVRAVP